MRGNVIALIVCAGTGTRMGESGRELPKPLQQVGGTSILRIMVANLNALGIPKILIVVGHKAELIRNEFTQESRDGLVHFIENPFYETSNNIVSVWSAQEFIRSRDVLLLEGDVIVDQTLLGELLSVGENAALTANFKGWMKGTAALVDDLGVITAMKTGALPADRLSKTVNVWYLKQDFVQTAFLPGIADTLNRDEVSSFYESIITDYVNNHPPEFRAIHCKDHEWHEVDSTADLRDANLKFSPGAATFTQINAAFGGHWRLAIQDHSLLENPFFPTDEFMQRLAAVGQESIRYYPPSQQIIAQDMASLLNFPSELLVVSNGISELIGNLGCILGRKVAIPVPSFDEYLHASQRLGIELATLELTPENDFHLGMDEMIGFIDTHVPDSVVIINPNNPTSTMNIRSDIEYLLASKPKLLVVVDESFMPLTDSATTNSVAPLINKHRNLVVVGSIGKAYGVGGLRLGYAISSNLAVVNSLRRCVSIWNINSLASEFLRLAIEYRKDFADSCKLARKQTLLLEADLQQIPCASIVPPSANFLMCRFGSLPARDIAIRLFQERRILVKPLDHKCFRNSKVYMRICAKDKTSNATLIQSLHKFVGEMSRVIK